MNKFFNGSSIFSKISIYYTLIVICSSIIIIFFTTRQVTEEITDLNISLHTNILNNVSNSLDDIYNDLNSLTKILAYEGNLENPFHSFLYSKDESNALSLDRDFSRFFLDFNNSRYNLSSIIVLNNTSNTPHFWGNSNIVQVSNYHFDDQEWYKTIKENEKKITILNTNVPDYLINFNTNKNMITFARNIYDIQKISDLRDIGTIIVNLHIETFQKIFEAYANEFQGDFYILDEDGSVIFDYKNQYTGTKSDTFSKLSKELTGKSGNKYVDLEGSKFINYTTIPSFQWKAVTVIPEAQLTKGIPKINATIILIVTIAIACALIILLLISKGFFQRIQLILRAIHRIEQGNFEPVARTTKKDEIEQLASSIDSMRLRLKQFIDISYVSSIRQQEAELKALQMQINPHFLYNTLESIRMKATLNNDIEVSRMIKILADLFRWNVRDKHAVISLEEELEFVAAYLEIQKIRFEERLEYTIDIAPELLSCGTLKLLLQPIVENAFMHGFNNKTGPCIVQIEAARQEDDLVISISDNGSGMTPEQIKAVNIKLQQYTSHDRETFSDIGIYNVHERILLLFKKNYGLELASNPQGGITVTVRFPAKYTMEMRKYVENHHSR